jgi:hypothetical protein
MKTFQCIPQLKNFTTTVLFKQNIFACLSFIYASIIFNHSNIQKKASHTMCRINVSLFSVVSTPFSNPVYPVFVQIYPQLV